MVRFSPRKAAISLYVYSGSSDHEYLLEGLGKYTIGNDPPKPTQRPWFFCPVEIPLCVTIVVVDH